MFLGDGACIGRYAVFEFGWRGKINRACGEDWICLRLTFFFFVDMAFFGFWEYIEGEISSALFDAGNQGPVLWKPPKSISFVCVSVFNMIILQGKGKEKLWK